MQSAGEKDVSHYIFRSYYCKSITKQTATSEKIAFLTLSLLHLTGQGVFVLENKLRENYAIGLSLAYWQWALICVIPCSSARSQRKCVCSEVSWNLIELTSAASLTLLILLTHNSARLESPWASLTLTLLNSQLPAADDNFPCTLRPRGLPAPLSCHICNKALITSVEVSSGILDMIIRSGALRDCNHLILSEHRAAWFLQLSSVSYYRIHYQEGRKQFRPENLKKQEVFFIISAPKTNISKEHKRNFCVYLMYV